MTTEEHRIAEIEARLKAATPAFWSTYLFGAAPLEKLGIVISPEQVKEISDALRARAGQMAAGDDVCTRIAAEIEPQLRVALDNAECGDPEERDALVTVLWDNKVGILRVLQSTLRPAPASDEKEGGE